MLAMQYKVYVVVQLFIELQNLELKEEMSSLSETWIIMKNILDLA